MRRGIARRLAPAGLVFVGLTSACQAPAWAQAAPVTAPPAAAPMSPPPPAAEPAAVIAARLLPDERIVLDGRLDHPAWARAPVFSDFVEKFPNTGAAPSHATRVQVLFDEQALYIGVQALDPSPASIRAPLVRHDGVNRTQDFVVAYIDAIGNRQSAQFFRVSAAGSTADGMHTAADDSEDFSPDFDWDAASARNDRGYTVVMRIPFASLRFVGGQSAGGEPSGWRFMLGRRVPREQFTLSTSVLIPRDAHSFISALQPLQGVVMPERHQFLTLRPSLTWRQNGEQPAGGQRQTQTELEASLDIKWRPLPELVVDATLNPDFSQVALDVPQLSGNTRYALSFPEKRPFFFESSDLLRSPTDALYTRSYTAPNAGLRGTWRGQRLAGTAFAIDDRGGGQVLLPGPYATRTAEQPASSGLAARAHGLAGALQWGAMAAARRYADGRGDNTVLGPDLEWQPLEAWRLRAQWLASRTTALPDGQGLLAAGPAQDGRRLTLKTYYKTEHHEFDASIDDIDRRFRDDSGFVNQNGVRSLSLRYGRGWQQVGPANDLWLNFNIDQVRDPQLGQLVLQDPYVGVWLTGAHNLEFSASLHADAQLRTQALSALLHQRFVQADLTVTPASWMPFLVASLKAGDLADVIADVVRPGATASLKLTLRPLARLEFEPSLSAARLREGDEPVYRETASQVLAVWHFDAQQSLRAIVQRSTLDRQAEPGVAAADQASVVASLTYAWRRSAGSVLYVGATRTRDGVGSYSYSDELFVKLQFDLSEALQLF